MVHHGRGGVPQNERSGVGHRAGLAQLQRVGQKKEYRQQYQEEYDDSDGSFQAIQGSFHRQNVQ